MFAFENETWLRLSLGYLLVVVSLVCHYLNKQKAALFFLVLGAFALRLCMISLDPLHEWDERFHALVAKNMITFPFKPMLHHNPLMDYDYKAWCCNHIWVHKQPLFLWQMALSMKMFGVNEMAMRLPSAIMGTISVFFIYEIVGFWTKEKSIAYIASLLFTISFFQLEMTSGRIGLDHNDIAFSFYVTASIWAFCKYIQKPNWIFTTLVGVFVGCAVLVKWLPGILVLGGWGLYVLLDKNKRKSVPSYLPIFFAALVALLIFLPWQIYIINAFPLESSWEYEFNRKHIFEALEGHSGSVFYHVRNISYLYGLPILVLILGLYLIYRKYNNNLSIVFLTMALVQYTFFSFVATKMPAFTFPVSSIILGVFGIAVFYVLNYFGRFFNTESRFKKFKHLVLFMLVVVVSNPFNISKKRSRTNQARNNKINNVQIYKKVSSQADMILNCKNLENVEFMFYNNVNAYNWFPSEEKIDSLLNYGYKIAVFKSHGVQWLPDYIRNNPNIEVIKDQLK